MESGIHTYKDFFELLSSVVTSIGAFALIYGVYAYNLNKKQLNFAVLDRCITIFQNNYLSISEKSEIEVLKNYVHFVNEEMFYFEQNYIPRNVALEWIDGMIEYMPVCNNKNKLENSQNPIAAKIHGAELLNSFQRVKKAFIVGHKYKYDFNLIYSAYENDEKFVKRRNERDRLTKEIYENLK